MSAGSHSDSEQGAKEQHESSAAAVWADPEVRGLVQEYVRRVTGSAEFAGWLAAGIVSRPPQPGEAGCDQVEVVRRCRTALRETLLRTPCAPPTATDDQHRGVDLFVEDIMRRLPNRELAAAASDAARRFLVRHMEGHLGTAQGLTVRVECGGPGSKWPTGWRSALKRVIRAGALRSADTWDPTLYLSMVYARWHPDDLDLDLNLAPSPYVEPAVVRRRVLRRRKLAAREETRLAFEELARALTVLRPLLIIARGATAESFLLVRCLRYMEGRRPAERLLRLSDVEWPPRPQPDLLDAHWRSLYDHPTAEQPWRPDTPVVPSVCLSPISGVSPPLRCEIDPEGWRPVYCHSIKQSCGFYCSVYTLHGLEACGRLAELLLLPSFLPIPGLVRLVVNYHGLELVYRGTAC